MKMKQLVTTFAGTMTGCLVTIAASMGLAVFSSSPAAAQSSVGGAAMLLDVEVVTARVPQSTVTSVHKKPTTGAGDFVGPAAPQPIRPSDRLKSAPTMHIRRGRL